VLTYRVEGIGAGLRSLILLVAVALLACGAPQSTTATASPTPEVGPLKVDLTVTGSAPFAGHQAGAFVSSAIACGISDMTMRAAEGTDVPVKKFAASWRVRVGGVDYTMLLIRAPYRGAGLYKFLVMPEDVISPRSKQTQGAFVVYTGNPKYDPSTGHVIGDYIYSSGGAHDQFTVGQDERSGTLDVDLYTKESFNSDTPSSSSGHISGTWRCV
jgi:hypothetical protein